jgi:hypothetical protein
MHRGRAGYRHRRRRQLDHTYQLHQVGRGLQVRIGLIAQRVVAARLEALVDGDLAIAILIEAATSSRKHPTRAVGELEVQRAHRAKAVAGGVDDDKRDAVRRGVRRVGTRCEVLVQARAMRQDRNWPAAGRHQAGRQVEIEVDRFRVLDGEHAARGRDGGDVLSGVNPEVVRLVAAERDAPDGPGDEPQAN